MEMEANIPEVTLSFERLRREQVPFATATALNAVAKTAQAAETKGIFERFHVRRPQRLRTAIAVKKASKRDLQVTVTVRDPFLVQHEDGETRHRGDIYRSLVRPVAPSAKAIGMIRGKNTPSAVLAAKGGFAVRMRDGKIGIFRRLGNQRTTKALGAWRSRAIELVFVYDRQDRLTGRLRFTDTVTQTVARDWEREFGASLARALATAR